MRLKTPAERKQITTIPGYRLSGCTAVPYLGIALRNIEFRQYDREPGVWYVEATAKIGTLDGYTIVLTLDQALEADFIERVVESGCRCPVCNGRDDDPAHIHGR